MNDTLSHNALLNFVVGPRGVGKTYSAKCRAIKRFIEKGEQFVYLRRYDTELKRVMLDRFFDDIRREFNGHELTINRAGDFLCDDMVMGWPIPLSKAAHFKSVPFPNVGIIIFDEFIIDKGLVSYLPHEVETFNEMYSTIARLRDVPVLFLSNAITYTNPYFLYFGLEVPKNAKYFKKNDMIVHYVDNPEFVDTSQKTRFSRIISGTDYAKYAIQNEFLRDSNAFIAPLPSGCNCRGLIKVEGKELGIYSLRGRIFISTKIDKTAPIKITMDKEANDGDYLTHKGGTGRAIVNRIIDQFYKGDLRFTDITAKNLIIRRLMGGI